MDFPGISFSDLLGKAEIHRHHAAHQPNSIGESEHAEENGLSESERVQSVVESDKSRNSERNNELSEDERKEVEQLRARDREVRAHENAHKAAAGSHARGGPHYDLQKGPDGRSYAVGGRVDIDISPVAGDPQATIQKMQVVRRAALAPAEPSGQDRSVAAAATRQMQQAQAELIRQRSEELTKSNEDESNSEKQVLLNQVLPNQESDDHQEPSLSQNNQDEPTSSLRNELSKRHPAFSTRTTSDDESRRTDPAQTLEGRYTPYASPDPVDTAEHFDFLA